jgi:DNA repair exonuclease SbcCD ATPase subunit/DNA repair exonuclease SbcCD nuclease subunit
LLIAHLSDIHIKNYKYHNQYKFVFNSLYEKLKLLNVDYIFITGDLVHTKTDMSPELIEMSSAFLENLADIAPLHIILGNHDLNLSNKDRQDAVTPIVEALKNPNIFLHKYSEKFTLLNDFNFHVLSIVDEENWNLETEEDKVNIALFHGSVEGCQTDIGFAMTHGDIQFSTLEKFDFALLGDIHKTNQALDHDGRCRFPGSLIQQNHGETNDKGFLLWDIKSKEDFSVQHIPVENPYPFFTIELTQDGKLPLNTRIPVNARLRLVSKYNLSPELMKKASDVAKERYKPESISFLSKNVNKSDSVMSGKEMAKDNLRSQKTQEKLMKDYLEDYKVPNDIMTQVYGINARYNSVVEATEEVCRNVNWKLSHIEWDNLFNYGENNKIDFANLSGIVGIFGKNYSGKSSVIDSILYTIFNTTSKNERKTTNVINQTKQFGRGKAVIEVDGFEYHIDRKAEKYTKKLKGEVSEEAKTELSLRCYDPISCQWDQMNELSRTDTDKRIRKMFGTIDDFMLTSFSSQLDSMSFIKEGSTKRKEILARFLDLEIFDAKFKIAKEESANLKGLLKKLEGKDYDSEIFTNQTLLSDYQIMIEEKNTEVQTVKNDIANVNAEIASLRLLMNDCGVESIDIQKLLSQKTKLENSLVALNAQKADKQTQLKEKQDLFAKVEEFINNFDLQDLKSKKEFVSTKQKQIDDFHEEIVVSKKELERIKLRSKLLNDIPCGDNYLTSCKLIKDAYDAKMQIPLYEDSIENDKQEKDKLEKEIQEYDLTKINSQLSKYEQIVVKKAQTEKEVLKLEVEIEKTINDISKFEIELSGVDIQVEQYKKNNELFAKIDQLKANLIKSENETNNLNNQLTRLDKELKNTYILVGSITNKIQTLENEKNELEQYRNQFAAYDYFMRCMHSNGISYEIIKKKLPVINSEISKILSNVVDFEVYFEDDGARLNVFIKHPKYDPRPIEMGSGAEKTIASMAIRLAMLQVSNLPKCNFMVMDEPGTALDSENMEGFIRMLEMVKSYYDVVLLISHMDALKDVVDTIITIDKKDGYANVRV